MKKVEKGKWWKSRRSGCGSDEAILRGCGAFPHKWLAFSRVLADSFPAARENRMSFVLEILSDLCLLLLILNLKFFLATAVAVLSLPLALNAHSL